MTRKLILLLFILFAGLPTQAQVTSVNGRTGDVVIQASDVEAVGNLNLTKIGFNVPNPFAHFHSSNTPAPGVNVTQLRFDMPGLPDEGPWEHTTLHVHDQGQRNYSIYSYGYNMTRSKPLEPLLGYRFEINYEPNPGQRWIEHYLEYQGPDGTIMRPFGFVFDRANHRVVEAAWKASKFIWQDDRDHTVMWGVAGEFGSNFTWGTPTNGTSFLFDRNDMPVLFQRGAGVDGGPLALPFYDAANNLRVGESPANGIHLRSNVGLNSSGPNNITRMWVQSDAVGKMGLLITPTFAGSQTAPLLETRDANGYATFRIMPNGVVMMGNGTSLQPVTVGEKDSCGPGKRCLTISN